MAKDQSGLCSLYRCSLYRFIAATKEPAIMTTKADCPVSMDFIKLRVVETAALPSMQKSIAMAVPAFIKTFLFSSIGNDKEILA